MAVIDECRAWDRRRQITHLSFHSPAVKLKKRFKSITYEVILFGIIELQVGNKTTSVMTTWGQHIEEDAPSFKHDDRVFTRKNQQDLV